MPNRQQIAFLSTFLLTISSLILLSRYINSKLVAAGYDFSRIILIGLPDGPQLPPMANQLVSFLQNLKLDDFRAVEVPILGTYDFIELVSSTTFIITAVIVVATAFYSKVLHTGTWPISPFFSSLSYLF